MQPGTYGVYALDPLDGAAFVGSVTVTRDAQSVDLALEPAFRVNGVTTFRQGLRTAANLTFTSSAGLVALRSDTLGRYAIDLPAATYAVNATTTGAEGGISVTYQAFASLSVTQATALNLELAKVAHRAVQVTWDSTEGTSVRPGGSAVYHVVVRNAGNEDDTYALSASTEGFTFSFRPDKVAVPFGSSGNTATVTVTIVAASDAKVEHAPLTLLARSQAEAGVVGSVTVNLTVNRVPGLTAKVSSDAPVWDGTYVNYTLEIHNAGNGAATYHLAIANLGELTAAGWQPAFVAPGMTPAASIDLTVAANTTSKPVLRFLRVGGSSGTLTSVQVTDTATPQSSALFTVSVQLPIVTVEGGLRAGGSGISTSVPGLDLATIAFLIAFLAFIAAVAYLAVLRRRSR